MFDPPCRTGYRDGARDREESGTRFAERQPSPGISTGELAAELTSVEGGSHLLRVVQELVAVPDVVYETTCLSLHSG